MGYGNNRVKRRKRKTGKMGKIRTGMSDGGKTEEKEKRGRK